MVDKYNITTMKEICLLLDKMSKEFFKKKKKKGQHNNKKCIEKVKEK